MHGRTECPECGSYSTEQADQQWYSDGVIEVRICNDCPVQYTLEFAHPIVEDIYHG